MSALLTARGISKVFPGVKALDNVDFDLNAGEVHAVVGENGAGKSTLMQILAGVYTRDEGTVEVDGIPCRLKDKRAAEKTGISIVFQESSLLQNLTVCENLFSGNPPAGRLGFIDWHVSMTRAAERLGTLAINVDPRAMTAALSVTDQKMVDIARALAGEFKILILDEPTAAITVTETKQLFGMIRALKADGKGIIYISHRIKEIREIADRVTVLKDGRTVGTYDVADVTEREICQRMVGRELAQFHYVSQVRKKTVLEVRGLSGEKFADVSFDLREGEFLTITGLSGAGRSELALALFGAVGVDGGQVIIDGKPRKIRSPGQAMAAGIGYMTEDRKKLGLFMDMGIAENMESNNIDTLTAGPFSMRRRTEAMARDNVDAFNIRCSGIRQQVQTLSGGNQQKVCLSRWVSFRPRILIVDEPTAGVDVGAKEEIYTILNELTREGMAVIMISSDMVETLAMGDRVMVMCAGRVMRIIESARAGEEEIVTLASGLQLSEDTP